MIRWAAAVAVLAAALILIFSPSDPTGAPRHG